MPGSQCSSNSPSGFAFWVLELQHVWRGGKVLPGVRWAPSRESYFPEVIKKTCPEKSRLFCFKHFLVVLYVELKHEAAIGCLS